MNAGRSRTHHHACGWNGSRVDAIVAVVVGGSVVEVEVLVESSGVLRAGLAIGYVSLMEKEQVHQRLHSALHRGGAKATEEELVEVTAVVLAVVAEIALELSVIIADLAARIEALEAK
jgi:hypothetical protein